MATTTQGLALTEAHATAQARNAALIALLLRRLWLALVDPKRLSETTVQWLELVVPQILAYYANAEDLAQAYYGAYRAVEAPEAPEFVVPDLEPPSIEQIRTSLSVTGVVRLEKEIQTILEQRVADAPENVVEAQIEAATRDQADDVAGAGSRLVIARGNDSIMEAHHADKVAFGYVRKTHADCCYFCAMLASRGPVFKDDSFIESNSFFNGGGPAKVHDSDRCTIAPVFSRSDEGFKEAKALEELWKSSTKGKSGARAILAFRQAYEGRTKSD